MIFDSKNGPSNTSRFIRMSDGYTDTCVVKLNPAWWSRPFEYDWASLFIGAAHTYCTLDAACGISHPFKLWLQHQDAHACDLDPRIVSDDAIVKDMIADFGADVFEAGEIAIRQMLTRIKRQQADIVKLPYQDKMFDRIFCISVLEHMERQDMLRALKEFKRALRPTGLVVLTFDVPTISTATFVNIVEASGLSFAGEFDPRVPDDVLRTSMYGGLSCFRAVLK